MKFLFILLLRVIWVFNVCNSFLFTLNLLVSILVQHKVHGPGVV